MAANLQPLDLPEMSTRVYFPELILQNEHHQIIDHNVYWLT